MSNLKIVNPHEFTKSPFKLIGSDWMLITAKKGDQVNTMTAAWGGFGVMWGKNVAYIVVRPQRYTKEFVDSADTFSLTFFDESYKKQLGYLGKVSGRDENKIEKAELTVADYEGTPYFEQANLTVICKKLYAQDFTPDSFIDTSLDKQWYPESDHHTMYIAEVLTILSAE